VVVGKGISTVGDGVGDGEAIKGRINQIKAETAPKSRTPKL
jgi:hypothetical protein